MNPESPVICPICKSTMQDRHRTMPPLMNRPQCEVIEYRWFCAGEHDGITHRLEISQYPKHGGGK